MDPLTGAANAWQVTDDGFGWEFTTRDGVKFHDGSELTVEDVAFKIGWALSEEAATVSIIRIAREIADQQITGPDTFKIIFKEPLGFFGATVSEIDNTPIETIFFKDYWMSMPLGAEIDNCTPVDICRRADAIEYNPGPGTAGPYNVVSHYPGEEIRYGRFEGYFAKDFQPYPFETIFLRLVPNLTARVAALGSPSGLGYAPDLALLPYDGDRRGD